MEALQARVESFAKTRRVKKSAGKASSASASLRWPHPDDFSATPSTLAEAGFFFSPSWHDRDSVACFLCHKELSDWHKDDDPFDIHYQKCTASCPWAIVRCGLLRDIDPDGRFVFDKARVPSAKPMELARLGTFADWWPHDPDQAHTATSLKMAQAGFVYTPQAAGDDTVTCLYCNLSLGGWEKGDDPMQEHRQRDNKSGADPCPFLASTKQTRSKAPKPPKKAPAEQSDDELAVVITDPAPAPRAKRGKARSTSATSKPRRKTRATRGKSAKSAAPRSPSPHQEEADAPMDVDDPPGPPPPDHPPQPSAEPDKPSTRVRASIPSPPAPAKPDPPTIRQPDPVLSLSPAGEPTIANTQSLTSQERTLTLEQWIRQEIGVSYERLQADGEKQIELFKTRAAEIRKCIDDL